MLNGSPPFICPSCSGELAPTDTSLRCASGHSFDLSSDGYVNLMTAGRLAGGIAGDSTEMIRARREFFDRGHYSPVMAGVAAMVSRSLDDRPGDHTPHPARRPVVLDAGCGEGSYLDAIRSAGPSDSPSLGGIERRGVECVGIDVSKPAIRLAARRVHDCRFAVASSYRIPLAAATCDIVVSVFAPRPYVEFARVLVDGGSIITASPGPRHLEGLRGALYDDPAPHENRPHVSEEGFAAPDQRAEVTFDLELDAADARRLLQMTPYWWSATAEQQNSLGEISTTVDIVVARHVVRPFDSQ